MATIIKFCVLLCKSPSKTLQMLDDVHGNAEIKKTGLTSATNIFVIAIQVLMMIRTAGNRQPQ
jgi:hypothetical protein